MCKKKVSLFVSDGIILNASCKNEIQDIKNECRFDSTDSAQKDDQYFSMN
jgi:hypothetical protein